jgi:hypothetical protein
MEFGLAQFSPFLFGLVFLSAPLLLISGLLSELESNALLIGNLMDIILQKPCGTKPS